MNCRRSSTWPPPTRSATARRPPRPAAWRCSKWAAWSRRRSAFGPLAMAPGSTRPGGMYAMELRQVRRDPAFSAIAIATLALGIGGITAMFSAFDAVLIRPLPYADADRLVMIWDAMGETDVTSRHNPTPAEWIEWRRLNTVFTDLASHSARRRDALGRRRTRTGSRAEGHMDLLERAWCAADARACLHRGRGQQERARRRDQPRTVAAPLRRRIRHHRTQDLAQRRALRSDRRHAARLLLHALARDRHLDAGVVPAVDADGTSPGTTPRSSRGSSPASRWSTPGSPWRH